MTNLDWLDLGVNQITGSIPPELGNLTNLYGLRLNDNQLTGSISSTFSGLTALQQFDVTGNCLTGGFEYVSHVPNLIGADAQVNSCSKGLPWLMLLLSDDGQSQATCDNCQCPCFSLSDINNATGSESFPNANCTDSQSVDGFSTSLQFSNLPNHFEFIIWFYPYPEGHGTMCTSSHLSGTIETSLEEAQACRQNIINSNIWLNPDENCLNR